MCPSAAACMYVCTATVSCSQCSDSATQCSLVLQANIASSVSDYRQQVTQLQAAAKKQARMAEERVQRVEQQVASMAQAKRELDNKVCFLS